MQIKIIQHIYKTFKLTSAMAKEESKLEKFKKDYDKLRKKHSLPSFEQLNEDFQIEKTSELETDTPIREIRRFVSDKLSSYLRFVEAMLNPSSSPAPMFTFAIVKTINHEDKNKLTEIFKLLAKNEIKLIEVDLKFIEKKEADYVKDSFKMWQEIKEDLLKVIQNMNKNLDNKNENNNKSYFG